MKKTEELVVITKTYDLILWSCNHTSRFPRQHRFVLGERLERTLYDLLETLIQVVVPCRTGAVQFGQIDNETGRSGRSQDSNALPGHCSFFFLQLATQFSDGLPVTFLRRFGELPL